MPLTFTFNDEQIVLEVNESSLIAVLDNLGYHQGGFAVTVNQKLIPSTALAQTHVRDGDLIQIYMAMQGG